MSMWHVITGSATCGVMYVAGSQVAGFWGGVLALGFGFLLLLIADEAARRDE